MGVFQRMWNAAMDPDYEKRSGGFTDAFGRVLLQAATGTLLNDPGGTGALELSAGMVGRCFQSVEVQDAGPSIARVLTPSFFGLVGRSLIRRGEQVFLIKVRNGRVVLIPAAMARVESGTYDPATWTYTLELHGPHLLTTMHVPSERVLHFRYAVDPGRLWAGVSPASVASLAAALNANLNKHLADEAGAPHGNLLPVPKDGNDDTLTPLKTTLKDLNGKTALVETTSSGYGDKEARPLYGDFNQRHFGMDTKEAMVTLRQDSDVLLAQLCGVPLSMMSKTDGTALREGLRHLLVTTLQPLGEAVAEELREKLDAPGLRLSWRRLHANDIQGKGRAFKSLVDAGMDATRAASVVGLD